MNAPDLHTMTGAYALHALPDGERAEFERHLSGCAPCAQEVRELTATAERLGLAVSLVPPPEMKERVLRRAATVRQEPPMIARHSRRGAAGVRRGRFLSRFALAACMAAAAGLGGATVWQYQAAQDARHEAGRAEQRAEALARVLAAPDAKATTGKLTGGATGTVVVSHNEDKAAFLASGLPPLHGGKVYQLWFDDGGTMRSAGLMDRKAATGSALLEGSVGHAAGVGITVEPAGGSEQPTTEPLALMQFPSEQGS
ncbi:anti-sigma factor [Streptomyces sp. NPDC004647]|uniref:anti-sigma factor n=1 Tax=Streptomyces sp. NPDC004647 TaxID=3154671 RepID=UPI0033B0CD6C